MSDAYRPVSSRQRLWIVVLAIVTASTILLSLIYRPGGARRPAVHEVTDQAVCAAGQSTGCVGGKADVIFVPPPAASGISAPR